MGGAGPEAEREAERMFIGFGLRALAAAFKAREGMLSERDMTDLEALHAAVMPQDAEVAAMLSRFRAVVEAGQPTAAAEQLLEELGRLSGVAAALDFSAARGRTQAALAEAGAADWQRRADIVGA